MHVVEVPECHVWRLLNCYCPRSAISHKSLLHGQKEDSYHPVRAVPEWMGRCPRSRRSLTGGKWQQGSLCGLPAYIFSRQSLGSPRHCAGVAHLQKDTCVLYYMDGHRSRPSSHFVGDKRRRRGTRPTSHDVGPVPRRRLLCLFFLWRISFTSSCHVSLRIGTVDNNADSVMGWGWGVGGGGDSAEWRLSYPIRDTRKMNKCRLFGRREAYYTDNCCCSRNVCSPTL